MSGFREAIDPHWGQPNFCITEPPLWMTVFPSVRAVDRILEPQTLARFLECAIGGDLPTGEKTTLPLFPGDLVSKYLMRPYSEWAPGSHDKFGVSPFDHVMIRVGSNEDASRLVIIEKGVAAMKARIWEGIAPISERRWREKRLDDPAFHHLACRHLGHVIEVFAYFQHPPVLNKLTQTYLLICEHLRDFDRVVNALPERSGEQRIGLAGLWEAFMTAHYTAMTTRAHAWVISKTQRLRDRDQELLGREAATSTLPDDSYSQETLEIGNRFQDLSELALRADYTIFMHLPTSDPPVGRLVPPLAVRRQQAGQAVRLRSRQYILEDTLRNIGAREQNPWSSLDSARIQREAQDVVRLELRGEAVNLPPVGWVASLTESIKHSKAETWDQPTWGIVAYRLTYHQSEEEWSAFLKKLETDLNDWGEGEYGVKNIKSKAQLYWFDGKALGITADDVEGAKKHFNTLPPDRVTVGWTDSVFLSIGSDSYDSYTRGSPFAALLLPGDTGGFVTAVDAKFDPNDRGEHAEESPHFPGHFRILSSVVFSDLYAMLAASTQSLDDLWPLAMNHPELLYTGPAVKVQVELWKRVSLLKLQLLQLIGDQIRKSEKERTSG